MVAPSGARRSRAIPAPRVLVVEDDDDTRQMLRASLTDEGFDVLSALDGMHALRIVAAGRPDVIVLDFGLPLLSGPEFTERWRQRTSDHQVPIIGISARHDAEEIAARLGIPLMRKPLDLAALAAAIRAAVAAAPTTERAEQVEHPEQTEQAATVEQSAT